MEATNEVGKGSGIEIDVPIILLPGTGFYDQPPFADVFSEVANNFPIDKSKLQVLFTSVARNEPRFFTKEWYGSPQYHKDRFKDAFESNKKSWNLDPQQRDLYLSAVCKAIDSMKEFPYISRYVSERFVNSLFAMDGSWQPRVKQVNFGGVPSYANWVTDELKREQQRKAGKAISVLAGIEEVSPKDLTGLGERSQTRRWRILKASNLVPERK